ncbi:MAG: DUF3090 domain-containing protein [Actinomycetota bacterium]
MELEPVDRITTGAVGEPGERTFFLQARIGERLVTITVEKEQVELLASSILEILATVDEETGEGLGQDELELEAPVDALWRAGRLAVGYSEERGLMMLELEEAVPEPEGEDEDAPEPAMLRLWATREQMLALSRQGAAVAARGRPRCQFCGNPMDPQGHMCPAMNGHRGQLGG